MATDDYEIRLAYTGGSVNTSYINDPRWTQPGYGDLMTIDWQDEVFRLAPKQNYTLSVSNSTDQSSYRVSLGYVDQKVLPSTLLIKTQFACQYADYNI